MAVLLEGQAKEGAHERLEVKRLGEHAGHRGLGGAVADVEDGHDADEHGAEHEGEELVLVDVDAHVLCDGLVGADGVNVGAELGVLENERAEREREERQDEVPGVRAEHLVLIGEAGTGPRGGEDREGLVNQGQADRDDQRGNTQLNVGEAVGGTEDSAAEDRGHDKARDAEHLREADGQQARQNKNRADGEVPQTHDDDEVEAAATYRVDQTGLQIGQHLIGRTEGARAQKLENDPYRDRDDEEQANAIPLALLSLL